MAKLDLKIESEIHLIEVNAIIKTKIGTGKTEINTIWLENFTVEQFEKMIELYESFFDKKSVPEVKDKNFDYGNEVMKHVNKVT